jgi:hypothetical protein
MNNTANQSQNPSFDQACEIRKFLHDEVFYLTFLAVVQRGKVYAPGTTRTGELRQALRDYLDRMAKVYKVPITEEAHLEYIVSLKRQVSASGGALYDERKFRIGSAQKALNLFLKYLWCLGEIPEPPHCPFDRRVIEHLPKEVRCSWVDCDDIEHYKRWVAAAREEAKKGSLSLAQWELCTFNKEWE